MRVLIVSANREEINMKTWPLGAASVATAAKRAGHAVEMLDLMQSGNPRDDVKRVLGRFKPQVIGVSVRNVDDQKMSDTKFFLDEAKELIQVFRAHSSARIVLGGAGYSMYPSGLLTYLGADMGIQGEGEGAFTELLNRLEAGAGLGGVPGLFVPGQGIQNVRAFEMNLDVFPLPENGFLPDPSLSNDAQFWVPVQSRRGCAMACNCCSTATIEGATLRKRSPDNVVQWIAKIANMGLRRFYFVDNTFNLPPSYAKALCWLLQESGLEISWRCIVYPWGMDDELARLMAQSGCTEVSVGFESGSQLILHGMNKRFRPQDVWNVCDILGNHRIRRMGFLLMGGPGETRETAMASLAFADSLNLECMKVSVGIRIYPFTALAQAAVEAGMLAADDDLVSPRFYLAPGLEDWLRDTLAEWMSTRPNWIT